MNWPILLLSCALSGALVVTVAMLIRARRAEFIRSYTLPHGLFEKLRGKRPELSQKDCQLVAHALRQFFLVYLKCGRRYVSMPSQVVDDSWHEFILYTRNYELFCRKAFGGFLHHTPAVVLSSAHKSNEGLRRCWWYACREDGIDPRNPTRLPLLFAIDRKLGIRDGFVYYADCGKPRREADADGGGGAPVHCGGDFQSTSYDGTTDGFGDSGGGSGSGSGGDASGCGGGCGGGD